MGQAELDRIRKIALALPGVNERSSHGALCFFARDKRPLCYFHDRDFSDDGRVSLWCPAPRGIADELVGLEPGRFFRPTPSAGGAFSDWLGVFLDSPGPDAPDWDEIAAVVEDAYRLVAPQRLVAQLADREPDVS